MGIFSITHICILLLPMSVLANPIAGADAETCQVRVDRLPPDTRGGQAYRLIYDIPVSVKSAWQFKTKFDNAFLEKNRYISHHRLISLVNNVAITENRYSILPKAVFRWKTKIYPQLRRLEFKLINKGRAGSHGHRFHYGHIQLNALGQFTRVIQEAYFDFRGSGFWAIYPWHGGMQSFLEYTARWECNEAVRFHQRLVMPSEARTLLP